MPVGWAVLAVGLVAAAMVGLTAGPAAADDPRGNTVGVTYLDPVKGTLDTPITALTSAPCPQGDYFVVRLYGKGLPADGANINGAMAIVGLPRTASNQLYIQLSYVLRDFAQDNVKGGVMKGTYDVAVRCREALKFASLGDFVGRLTVTGNSFRVIGAAAVPKPYTGPKPAQPSQAATQGAVPNASGGVSPGTDASAPPGGAASSAAPGAAASVGASSKPSSSKLAPVNTGASTRGRSTRSKLLFGGGIVLVLLALLLLLGDRLRTAFRRRAPAPSTEEPPVDNRRLVKKP